MPPFTNAHLSASRLQRYEQCPRSFRFHYVDQLPSQSGPELLFGKAMHAALEQLLREHRANHAAPAALSIERAEQVWQQAWTGSALTGLLLFFDGCRMVDSFVQSEGVVDPASVLAIEQPFEIAIGRFRVVGAIDRVDRTGARSIVIRDYKTSRLIPSRDELAEHLQLGTYQLAAQQLWPWAEKIDLQLDMLRHDVRLRTSRTDAELVALRQYIEALGERIEADEQFAPRPSPGCARCEYRASCSAYADALAGKRKAIAVDLNDLTAVAAEREECARIAKVAYERKSELEDVLRAHLETQERLELGGMRYELAPVASVEYPVDATLQLLQDATGLPAATLRAKLLSVDRQALTKLLADLGKRLPRPRVTMLRAELAARASKSISQRFSARPVRASAPPTETTRAADGGAQ